MHATIPNRSVAIPATEPQPGLRIYRRPPEYVTPGDPYVWHLGHHSGHVIAAFETSGDADEAAWAIRDLTDWTRSVEEIRAAVDGETVRDALEQSPGIFLSRHDA